MADGSTAASNRGDALAAVLIALSALACLVLPLLPALASGEVPGSGPDVVSTLWGVWWATQEPLLASFGGWTDLVNHPAGAIGALLSPSTTLSWALLEPLVGPGDAMSGAALLQVGGLALGTAFLARQVNLGWAAAAFASLAVLTGRYLPYGVGEGSVVAIAALPLPLGLGLLTRLGRRFPEEGPVGGWAAAVGLALCMGWMGVENPYLAPVLPGCTLVLLLASLRPGGPPGVPSLLVLAMLLGSGLILADSAAFARAASPDYPVEVAGSVVRLGGVEWQVADMPWARAEALDLFWPDAVKWTDGVDSARDNPGGGRYLGLSVGLLALLGSGLRWRRALPWTALAVAMLLLSLGSMVGPAAGPFLFLNALMDEVARPLTQPTRFLAVGVVALAVCAAVAAQAVQQRFGSGALLALGAVMLGDALLVGGPSLELPSLALPELGCEEALPEGAVLVWPADVLGRWSDEQQLLQLAHRRPAAHRGIASWRLEEPRIDQELRKLKASVQVKGRFDAAALGERGYRSVLVQPSSTKSERTLLLSTLGEPIMACGAYQVHALEAP